MPGVRPQQITQCAARPGFDEAVDLFNVLQCLDLGTDAPMTRKQFTVLRLDDRTQRKAFKNQQKTIVNGQAILKFTLLFESEVCRGAPRFVVPTEEVDEGGICHFQCQQVEHDLAGKGPAVHKIAQEKVGRRGGRRGGGQ